MSFSEKLISLRRAKGLSQEQLANLLTVSRQAVSKWETGESQPDLAKLIVLSNIFEISLDELCGRKPDSAGAAPPSAPKPSVRVQWLCAAALAAGLALGLAGGLWSSGVLFSDTSKQKIQNITITGFSMNRDPELRYNKIHLVYSLSIAKKTFRYKVLKTDSEGNISSFPAVYKDGVCTCDVAFDNFHGTFALSSVISDGGIEYTSGLVDALTIDAEGRGMGYQPVWNK